MSKGKRVLIITYNWPPSGGISVLRCLKFAKYLHLLGWEPVIYTASNAQYFNIDHSNEKDIPEGLTVLSQPIWEPFALFKKLSGRKKSDTSNPVYIRDRKPSLVDQISIWIRGNLFIPDARAAWIKPSVKYLVKHLESNPVDVILSDGPPHTNTAIACEVAERTGIPWLADFQDPWTQVDYYPMMKIGKIADRIHHKMEAKALSVAKKTTIVSPTWKEDLESIGAHDVSVIYWGYDEDDFRDLKKSADHKFKIVHAGMLGYDRLPDILLRVLGELCEEQPEIKEKLELQFLGEIDYQVRQLLSENGLEENAVIAGQVSRPEALQQIMNADLLLLLLNKAENAKGRLPGKLYEYLRTYNPILCLGEPESDAANILSHCQIGATFDYDDASSIKEFILKSFNHQFEPVNKNAIQEFDLKNQVFELSKLLEEIRVK